ncbi:hypothetical protein LINGRAHAP2_LOCUS13021 [Linum grandiflorum]
MSLFIGNLSSHTHKDELERVFRRFGQCDVRVKDRYGFVVYEFPPNAEKALKSLQKKYICGQLLNLTWSKKQPRPFDRHGRSAARYEPEYGRYSSRGADDAQNKVNLSSRGDYRMLSEHEDENERRVRSDMLQEGTAYYPDEIKDVSGQEHPSHRGDEMEDNGRWDLKLDDRPNGNDVSNGIEFDRYEPRHSGGSPSKRSFPRDRRRDHTVEGNINRKISCYGCGGLGHKMWNCPEKSSQRRKLSKFDQRGNSNASRKRRSENEMGEDVEIDVKSYSSRKHQPLGKYNSSPTEKGVGTVQIKDHERKKRNRERSRSPKRRSTKRGRRSVSSPPGSNHKRSRSVPKSSKHTRISNGHSRSRSGSSDSRSGSTSHRLRTAKSRSRSNSPASLSLSVSLGQPLPSTNNAQLGQEGSVDTVKAADSREIGVEKDLAVEINTRPEHSGLANEVTLENSTFSLDLECEVGKGELPLMDNSENLSASLNDVIDPSMSLTKNVACPATKPESELSVIPGTSKSTYVSSEELCLVLKHYGLDLPDEEEMHLNPDAYYGSARFWPWEIIHYRRLKKGLISIENYANRMEQNHKFGIVDKYVRSSSGWEEPDQCSMVHLDFSE